MTLGYALILLEKNEGVNTVDLGSPYGIDEGRISKLMLKRDGQIIANFDRGWDIEPIDANAQAALKALMKKYN